MRSAKEFYHVVVTFQQGHTETVLKTWDPVQAEHYAREHVSWSPDIVKRIEIRDNWGESGINLLFVA